MFGLRMHDFFFEACFVTDLENEFMVTREEGQGEAIDWEFGIDTYTLLYLKQTTNKDLLYRQGTLLTTLINAQY